MRTAPTLPTLVAVLALVACGDKDDDAVNSGGGGSSGDTNVDADGDGFLEAEDCDDEDAGAYPGAPELCDGVDNDCDDEIDESAEDATTFYQDGDGDGFGDDAATGSACEAPSGFVDVGGDCDDADADAFPGGEEICDDVDNDCDGDIDEADATDALVWYGDGDADGHGDPDRSQMACTEPAGFVADDTDCNDQSDAAHPGAAEVCDGLDNDCNGETDEDASADAPAWFMDGDGDGYGDSALTIVQCAQPTDYVADDTDCDDTTSTTNPGASEYCDGVDNDCDGALDEDDAVDTSTWYADGDGDGYGDASASTQTCDAPSAHVADATDCDDTAAAVNPAAVEVCNGIDDDCNGSSDDADAGLDTSTASTWFNDGDTDGYGDASASSLTCDAPSGYIADGSDCDDTDSAVNPGATEVCNEVDDDCDGDTDDSDSSLDTSTGSTWYADGDADGYGDAATTVAACDAPSGYSADDSDCDDTAAAVNPAASEVCNEIDDDCDGDIDDADSSVDTSTGGTFYTDADADGFGDASTAFAACDQPSGAVVDATDCDDSQATSYPGADEYCNTRDDDCDGTIDEDDALDTLTWYLDGDSDGFGDAAITVPACNQPSGYVGDDSDCDDSAGGVYPGASEICNTIDDDCDGAIDDADASVDTSTGQTWYADLDADSYGSLTSSVDACTAPSSYVADSSDCDDTSAANFPGADEYCDTVDNDCDGSTDESDAVDAATWYRDADLDGYGDGGASVPSCSGPSGYVSDATDCDDADATISPGTTETWYDGVDSDCGSDNDYDADADGYQSEAHAGTDCDDADASVSPGATEVWYDGVDSDCDEANDYDADADGYDSDAHGGDDCNDQDAAVYPGVVEVWYDGIDADCDGAPDDDADGDGFDGSAAGGGDCDDSDHTVHPYAFEAADGIDNDCDGSTDESTSTPLGLSDDGTTIVSYSFSFPFCGSTYSSLTVAANGMLYFSGANADFSETEAEFISRGESIAMFWDDLNPSQGGEIYVEEHGDAFGIYFDDVPEFYATGSNTFGTVIFDDGTILQTFNGMSALDAIVGWSCATGVAGAVDISAEIGALDPADRYIGDGSEDAMYELFSSSTNPMDLDGESVWYTGAP